MTKRGRDLALFGLFAAAFGAVAFFAPTLRYVLTGHPHSTHRYSDVGGAFLTAFDAITAAGCGALIGLGFAERIVREEGASRSRLLLWFFEIVPGAILAYLLFVANFGR